MCEASSLPARHQPRFTAPVGVRDQYLLQHSWLCLPWDAAALLLSEDVDWGGVPGSSDQSPLSASLHPRPCLPQSSSDAPFSNVGGTRWLQGLELVFSFYKWAGSDKPQQDGVWLASFP